MSQCELEEAGLDIDLLNRMHEDNSQVKEELQIWGRAYIDVDQLVEENLQLRLEAEELRNTGKELRERLAVFEAGKSFMEDNTRWVEGSSDMERQEESFNCNYRSGNTVVIACNAEPSSVRRFPRRSRVSRVEVVTSDTSDSDKSSFSWPSSSGSRTIASSVSSSSLGAFSPSSPSKPPSSSPSSS